jgi:hypothetical protein
MSNSSLQRTFSVILATILLTLLVVLLFESNYQVNVASLIVLSKLSSSNAPTTPTNYTSAKYTTTTTTSNTTTTSTTESTLQPVDHKPIETKRLIELIGSLKPMTGLIPNVTIRYNLQDLFTTKEINNPHEYPLLINPSIDDCKETSLKQKITLLAIVIVAPDFFEQRSVIRATWANEYGNMEST